MKLSFKLITKILVIFFILFTLQANALQIGDKAPNFKADTTLGELDFYDWSQGQWVILLSHPGDFTPVCTTELAEAAKLQPLLKKKNAKILTLSADSVEDHLEWVEVINNYKNKTTTTDDLKNLLLG
jgi:alkyl hydroperoxide reductase subunit AhpC